MTLFRVLIRTLRHLFTPLHTNTMLSSSFPHKLLVLLFAFVFLCPPRVHAFGVCRNSFRCFNGGVERYGTSIFSPCRCQCQAGYTGPRCQYREAFGKRSASLTALTHLIQATLQQEQREQEQQQEVFYNEDDDADEDYDYDSLSVLPPQEEESGRRLHPKFFRR